MIVREPEAGLLDVLKEKRVGCITFMPLAQGLLTDKYLKGIPKNSRTSSPNGHLKLEEVLDLKVQKIRVVNEIGQRRNQSLAQMALLLKDNRITSVLICASFVGQLNNNIDSLQHLDFSERELIAINTILG
jgi:L-glyceraldehyde 3-phosphate reductase